MSAQSAEVVPFPQKRAPQAQPVTKLQVLERVRGLVCEGELQAIDLNVVQYIAEITDKETGAACVEVATIGERIGRSRPTVVRSLRRLIDADLIERHARRRGKRCFASFYRLVVPGGAPASDKCGTPRFTDEPTPVHECTTSRAFNKNLSPNRLNPYRGRIVEIASWSGADWNDCVEWLALHGKYRRWGPGPGEAFSLAMQDLHRWREFCGDRAVVAAIELAKRGNGGTGWFGDYLIERLNERLGGG